MSILALSFMLNAQPGSPEEEIHYKASDHIIYGTTHKTEARAMVAAANIIFNCIKGGIGKAIQDKNFFEGCSKGAAGGAVSYLGMYIATYSNRQGLGAAGKLTFDLGNSISDNVMLDKEMFSQYRTSFGPAVITIGRDAGLGFTLDPVAGIGEALITGQKLNVKDTLTNLTFVFDDKRKNGRYVAYATSNIVSISNQYPNLRKLFLSHELTHTFQYQRFIALHDILQQNETIKRIDSCAGKYWYYGQDIGHLVYHGSEQLLLRGIDGYYSRPTEVEAYFMERF